MFVVKPSSSQAKRDANVYVHPVSGSHSGSSSFSSSSTRAANSRSAAGPERRVPYPHGQISLENVSEGGRGSSVRLPQGQIDLENLGGETMKSGGTQQPLSIPMPKWIQPYVAEGCGICVLLLFGLIADIQQVLSGPLDEPTQRNDVAYAFGWGVGLMSGLLVTIDVSGGHINPAITLCQCLFRGFSWKRLPGYWFAQLLGSFVGGCIVQGLYYQDISNFEGGDGVRTWKSAVLFIHKSASWQSNVDSYFVQFVAGGLFLLGVSIVTDPRAAAHWATWTKALVMLWVFIGVNGCLGVNPAYVINPARDLGVRMSCSCFGYPNYIWTDRSWWWTWGCLMGPIGGGIVFTALYDWVVRGRVELTIPPLTRVVSLVRKHGRRGSRKLEGAEVMA